MRRSLSGRSPLSAARRFLSANEAAVALRPFYFAVHPDRFATMPDVRSKNEKALQIFNGYLNDLFPRPTLSSHRPIQVHFSIIDKGSGSLTNVNLSLAGTDPGHIVRQALESCKLPTSQLPRSSLVSPSPFSSPSPTQSTPSTSTDLVAEYLKRKKKQRGNDIITLLRRSRHDAITKTKQFEMTKQTLKEEIEEVKQRTGVKDVEWTMDWADSHMRRCLSGVHRLLEHATSLEKDRILASLRNNTLRFGRGSYISCDGAVQFGADNVPEQWLQVCCEASVRRAQLGQLRETRLQLQETLGGATVLLQKGKGLEQTLHQMNTLLTRISSRPPEMRQSIAKLAASTMVEVMTSYDELSVGQDGRLHVPCNVDVVALLQFLSASAASSREVNSRAVEMAAEVREEREEIKRELRLAGLDWEVAVPLPALLSSLHKLRSSPPSLTSQLVGLHLRFSTNPSLHIRPDGKISFPLEWSL